MDIATKQKDITIRRLVVPSLAPTLAVGSFADYPCNKHTSFWGTFDWPHDCFDHWNPKNPRRILNQKSPLNMQRAEDFINIHELRHLLYNKIIEEAESTNLLRDYSGLLMTCKTIKEEMTVKLLEARCDLYRRAERFWSDMYMAAYLITDPAELKDVMVAKVQLPRSMFTEEWQIQLNNRAEEAYDSDMEDQAYDSDQEDEEPPHDEPVQSDILLSELPLAHLKITTYSDTSDSILLSNLIREYARTLGIYLGSNTTFDKVTFRWDAILPPGTAELWQVSEPITVEMMILSAEILRWDQMEGWDREAICLENGVSVVGVTWTRVKDGEAEAEMA